MRCDADPRPVHGEPGSVGVRQRHRAPGRGRCFPCCITKRPPASSPNLPANVSRAGDWSGLAVALDGRYSRGYNLDSLDRRDLDDEDLAASGGEEPLQ